MQLFTYLINFFNNIIQYNTYQNIELSSNTYYIGFIVLNLLIFLYSGIDYINFLVGFCYPFILLLQSLYTKNDALLIDLVMYYSFYTIMLFVFDIINKLLGLSFILNIIKFFVITFLLHRNTTNLLINKLEQYYNIYNENNEYITMFINVCEKIILFTNNILSFFTKY